MMRTKSIMKELLMGKRLLLAALVAVVAVCAFAIPSDAQAAPDRDNQVVITPRPVPHYATHVTVQFYGAQTWQSSVTFRINNNVMTGVTWTDSRTAVIPIPEGAIQPGETFNTNVSNFRFWMFDPSDGWSGWVSAAQTVVTLAAPPEVPLIKNLIVPQGAVTPMPDPAPTFDFDFTFTPVQVTLDATPPAIQSRPVADFATIITSPQTVTVDLDNAPTATDNAATPPTYTFSGELNLWALFHANRASFPGAGVYVWNVAEVAGSSSTGSDMTYSTERYQVRLWIDRNNRVYDVRIYPITGGTSPNYTIGTKRADMPFNNRWEPSPSVDLEITKYVEGLLANLETPFTFNLALTGSDIPTPITAVIYVENDASPPVLVPSGRTVTITNGSATGFTLLHGDTLIVRNLPVGTTFNVTETAIESFRPDVEVFVGGTSVHEASAGFNQSLSTGNRTLSADSGRNAADFVNHFELGPPETGLFVANNLPWMLLVLPVAALAVHVARRNRKAIEELAL